MTLIAGFVNRLAGQVLLAANHFGQAEWSKYYMESGGITRCSMLYSSGYQSNLLMRL